MDVGIRQLKQHLSEYLDRVERGEIIRVTDRGPAGCAGRASAAERQVAVALAVLDETLIRVGNLRYTEEPPARSPIGLIVVPSSRWPGTLRRPPG